MLSLAKISNADYYLKTVANGIEDYYALGEAPGRWTGHSAALLGLDGEVQPDQLSAVLAGHNPLNGDVLLDSANRTVPAFDPTFRAPKSVSIAFGLGDEAMTEQIMGAHDASVDAALGYLERTAAWSRKGHNGVEQVPADGFVAAAFRHRTSRAGDPHLHTHVLVANMVRSTDDGRWRTIDARHVYAQSLTAGYLYESHLREELTRRLGVAWTPIVNGIADLDGVPKDVQRAFSTRREQIEAHMALRGESSPRAAEIAALDTRRAKDHDLDITALRERWIETAATLGYTPHQLNLLMDVKRQNVLVPAHPDDLVATEQHLLSPEGLTARGSTFDRRDVLRALAAAYPNGANVRLLEAHADMILAHTDVVKVLDASADTLRADTGRAVTRVDLGARYSTRELLALEQRLVCSAVERLSNDLGATPGPVVEAAFDSRPSLSDEQRRLVEAVTMSRSGVQVVVAPAGAGKTFALAAANEAWTASRRNVIGAALSARAGAELEASAGISSMTLARLAADVTVINRRDVVVIDEAGMAPTRLVAPILDRAAQVEAKVVLVGDPRQLPEIGAGGLLAGLSARLPAIELGENRRQRHTWEQLALKELRSGRIAKALDAYEQHDRIITSTSALDAKARIVDDWAAARALGADTIMLASRNADIADLNTLARVRRQELGALSGPALRIEAGDRIREFQAGDEILLLRNYRRLQLRNGTRATIDRIHERSNHAMTIIASDGGRQAIPTWYAEAGHVTHGYAMTIHKAQGLTCDEALVYATDDLYQELGYVAMSRGRDINRLYLAGTPMLDLEATDHGLVQERTARQALLGGLSNSRAQELALDAQARGDQRPIERWTVPELLVEKRRLNTLTANTPTDRSVDIARLEQRIEDLQRSHVYNSDEYARLEQRRRPLLERLRGPDVELAQAADRRDQAATELTFVNRELRGVAAAQRSRERYLDEHADAPGLVKRIERIVSDRIENAVANDMIETPEYLRDLIGDYRTTKHPERWLGAARDVERHRLTHEIDDAVLAFGERPPNWADALRWDKQHEHVIELSEPEHVIARSRGIGMHM